MKTEYLIKIGSVAKWLVPFFAAVALLGRSWEMHHGF